MANRIRGNVYIIDSQTGMDAGLQPGSASWQGHSMQISTVALWCADTTSKMELVFASNTGDSAFVLSPWTAPAPSGGNTVFLDVGGINFEELRCKTLTNGTGWIYFS